MPEDTTGQLPVPATALPTTVKILKFAQYYLECGNALEAARRAGYRAATDAALQQMAYRLLQRDDVALHVATHLKALISPEEAGAILSDILRGSVEHFLEFDETGDFKINLSSPEAQSHLHLIKSIKPTKFGLEIQLHDKIQALAIYAKHMHLDDPKSMQRRAVEAILERLSPEERGRVREELTKEHSPDVIEGEKLTPVQEDLDLSFLTAGVDVPLDPESESEPEPEVSDE